MVMVLAETPHSMDHVPLGRLMDPVPEKVSEVTGEPESPAVSVVPSPIPSQVTAPGTEMVRALIVVLPPAKSSGRSGQSGGRRPICGVGIPCTAVCGGCSIVVPPLLSLRTGLISQERKGQTKTGRNAS